MSAELAGLYGGTFDPIHQGHLAPVEQIAAQIGLEQVVLMPCHIPPHRQSPAVDSTHRLAMVKLAAEAYPRFRVSDWEITRQAPSYTVDTLHHLCQTWPDKHWYVFIGMDSLLSFHRWHRYQDILTMANLVVALRPGAVIEAADAEITRLLAEHRVVGIDALKHSKAGAIYLAENELQDVSATELRQQLQTGNTSHPMLNADVSRYIAHHGLYQTTPQA